MLVVFATYPDLKKAKEAAKNLVEKKLSACVNIVKLEQTIYRWKGKIVEDDEYLLIIKTSDKTYARSEREIRKNHPYELAEIIAIKVNKGNQKYINWINRSCLGF